MIDQALHVLDKYRTVAPDLCADLEVALRQVVNSESHPLLSSTDDAEFLTLAVDLCPNLAKIMINNRYGNETVSHREEFQSLGLRPVHVNRWIEELNKLPSDSPFVQLSILSNKVIHWANADLGILNG